MSEQENITIQLTLTPKGQLFKAILNSQQQNEDIGKLLNSIINQLDFLEPAGSWIMKDKSAVGFQDKLLPISEVVNLSGHNLVLMFDKESRITIIENKMMPKIEVAK